MVTTNQNRCNSNDLCRYCKTYEKTYLLCGLLLGGDGFVDELRQGDGDLIGRVQIRIPDKPSLKVKHAAKEFDKECGDFADELAKER